MQSIHVMDKKIWSLILYIDAYSLLFLTSPSLFFFLIALSMYYLMYVQNDETMSENIKLKCYHFFLKVNFSSILTKNRKGRKQKKKRTEELWGQPTTKKDRIEKLFWKKGKYGVFCSPFCRIVHYLNNIMKSYVLCYICTFIDRTW
jgi:hypothetical protein